jgi:heat shock protein HslJ
MRTHRALTPVLLLTAALTLAACGDTDDPAPADPGQLDLVGRTFVGDQVTVDDEPEPLVMNTSIRLTFSDGSIGASAGCNQMGGDATWDDGVLKVQNMSTTEMAADAARHMALGLPLLEADVAAGRRHPDLDQQ